MMNKLYSKLYIFLTDEKGATMVEYGFIGTLVGGGLMAAAFTIGDDFIEMFNGDSGMTTLLDGVTDRYADGSNTGGVK